ncbi:secondary thiamine-phosphate synthase enzyme [Halomicronema hongdechloris C2206]|uniref:Secondary thiamine-phosphate synthase enzyme n=1 Tax=Halomicronema hongdechloris C2206 TaxID=1641165 RepID=A0A1Z3HMH2_9CYAN|nr:secondary thiamine-phosphate synthase enzyme YjbQ [Halomicronema hongdechloris]ASC71475.1 secondary thiamine-phosphate synthase enzyme [Halomicronema hongdechloris C2206]
MTTSTLPRHHQRQLTLATQGKSFQRFTQDVQAVVTESGIQTGLCSIFIRHTSASLVIQENADPDVLRDLATFFARLVPEDGSYIHSTEGPDDMPAHIRSALTHTSEQIPVMKGRLALGTWQGIYLWEHRARGSRREIVIHVTGT